jgi:uncharacterized protein (UPF0261 family)
LIGIVATLDTKGEKVAYINQLLKENGLETVVVDSGILGVPSFPGDITREKVAEAAGRSLESIGALGDETEAVQAMAVGTAKIVNDLYAAGKLDGVIGITGTLGMSLWLSVMKSLPIGLPKVLCCTTAFVPFCQPEKCPADLLIVPLVSDIWGINSLTRRSLANAAGAIIGITRLNQQYRIAAERPILAVSTLGTSALTYITELTPYLEKRGYEVAAFHVGQGQGMEQLVRQGAFAGVLDLSLIEVAIEACNLPFIPARRLEAAVESGVPLVVAPGGVVFKVWWGSEFTMPEVLKKMKRRLHGELAWQIEMTLEEVARTARLVAQRLNRGKGPRAVVIPMHGFIEWDKPGGLFYDPQRPGIFTAALKESLKADIEVIELEAHINDKKFADEAAGVFLSLIGA